MTTRNLLDLMIGCAMFLAGSLASAFDRSRKKARARIQRVALLPAPGVQHIS